MGWILPVIMAGSAIAGGILGGRKKANQQTPIEPPEFNPLRDLLLKQAMERLKTPSSLIPGYEATGIRNINQNSDLMQQSLENRLGAAGLLGSGVHGAGLTDLSMRRFGDINDLQNIELPRLTEDIYNTRFNQALGLYNQRKTGVQLPGSATGSGFTSGAGMLALLYGMGAFGKLGAGGETPTFGPRG